jgi:hypothetical protein
MNMSLLKKVRELTLYMIKQNKELKNQKVQLQLQKDKIIFLEIQILTIHRAQIKIKKI